MMRKCLAVAVILLFIGVAFAIPINAMVDSKTSNENISLIDTETIFYGYASILIEIDDEGRHMHREIHTHNSQPHFDADLDELVLEIVMNYSAEMNYTMKFPFVLAPLFAFGLNVENYTDYKWESFKLKHHGYAKREGIISIEVDIDMENIESGDLIILQPYVCAVSNPNIHQDINHSWILRFVCSIPLVNKFLLSYWLFPIIIPDSEYFKGAPIYIFFD